MLLTAGEGLEQRLEADVEEAGILLACRHGCRGYVATVTDGRGWDEALRMESAEMGDTCARCCYLAGKTTPSPTVFCSLRTAIHRCHQEMRAANPLRGQLEGGREGRKGGERTMEGKGRTARVWSL